MALLLGLLNIKSILKAAVRQVEATEKEKEMKRRTGGGDPSVVEAAEASSPGNRRKRRSSSLLFTRTLAVGLGDLARIGLLEGNVGFRWREVRHRMECEATLPLILHLVVVRVLEAVAHWWWRRRSSSNPWSVRRKRRSAPGSTARGLWAGPTNR